MTKSLRLASCLILITPFLTVRAADPAPTDPANPPAVVIERAPETDRGAAAEDAMKLREENRRLTDELATEKTRANEAFARLGTLNTGVERLLQEKATLTAELEQARNTETALREKLAIAEQSLAKTPPDVAAKLAETEAKLAAAEQRQAVLDADNQLLKTASAEQVRLTAELEKMRQEKSARDAAAPTVEELKSRVAETQQKLDTVLRSYSLLQTENEQLKTAASSAPAAQPVAPGPAGGDTTALTAEVEKLRRDQAQAESELATLRRDKEALEAKAAAAPPDRSAEIAAKLAETENKLATTLRSFTQLQGEHEQLKATAGNEAALRTEVETLRRDHAALEAKVAETPAAPAPDVVGRLADTEGKLSTVLRSYSLLQAENDRLKTESTRASDTAQATSAKAAADAAAQISALFDELRQSRAQATSMAAENSQLKTRLALVGAPPGSMLSAPVRPGTAAATAAAIPEPQPVAPAGPRTHVVVAGDSLARLSREYYGTANRWDEILRANRDLIQNENVLPIGATLKIP